MTGLKLIILPRDRFITTDYPTKRQDQHTDDRFKTDHLARDRFITTDYPTKRQDYTR